MSTEAPAAPATAEPPAEGGLAEAFQKAMSANDAPPEPPKEAPAPEKPAAEKVVEKPDVPKSPKGELKSLAGIPDDIFSAPKKETKEGEPKTDFDSEALSKNLSTKGRENWKKMESHYEQRLAEIARERDEAKAAVQNAVKGEEVEALKGEREAMKKQLDEMNAVIERISLEHSPRFRQQFVEAREKLVGEASKRVKTAGGDPAKFLEALSLEGRDRYTRLEEALGEAPAFIINQVSALVTQIEDLDEQRQQAIKNGSQSLTQWQQEELSMRRQEAEKAMEAKQRAANEIMDTLPDEVLFLRKIPGNDEWNAKVDGMKENARKLLFESDDYPSFVKAAVKATAYDAMQSAFEALREKYIAAMQELEELRAAEPGTGAGGGGGSGEGEKPKEAESLADRYLREMQAA